ncbi:MAG TPA: hypothetical protein VNG31_07220 [Candidatus Baltobacteraceae bacterium]|nr:hypothetical protein [Candidatus Baltobacteraceae bacterium]
MAPAPDAAYARYVLVELAVIVLSVVGFVLLDLYVLGCEKV